jgi:UDP-N-acetylglucosamine 2-epimerase (non-hydrolysing)
MMHVLITLGTRPEAIKLAPVVVALRDRPDLFRVEVCATAQHREMLAQMLALFRIKPDYDLDVMAERQTPSQVAARILERFDAVLAQSNPDWVLVQGDTTTVMAASIACYHRQVHVGHVEAGLRTGDKWQPFPEEINRRITDTLGDLHFAPTVTARDNLLREGVPAASIIITGNTVIDALLHITSLPHHFNSEPLASIVSGDQKVVLVTAHRRENFGQPLRGICAALRAIAKHYDGAVEIVYPVHPNPVVRDLVYQELENEPHVTLTDPLDYADLVHLIQRSYLVLTDSGGIQEEAPTLGKPVLILRAVTERPEGVAAGAARLVGTDCQRIVEATVQLLDDATAYQAMAHKTDLYGDGQASQRILRALADWDAVQADA